MWDRKEKSCTCGNKIDDPDVVAEAKYSWNNWLILLFVSYTGHPKEIIFRCLHCGGIVARTRDPEMLEKYNDSAEIISVRENEEVNTNFRKSAYNTPLNTNITGTALAPQSDKSLQGSMMMLYIVIGSIVFTALVLFALIAVVR